MQEQTKTRLRVLIQPLVKSLAAVDVPPNAVTIAGLVMSLGTAFLLSQGWFLAGGLLLLIAGLADTVDGELARRENRASRLGAFLDSNVDRFSEFALFFGLYWFFRARPDLTALIFASLFASFAVSYVRARAEGVGIECRVGLFERPVRFVFLVLGVFFHHYLNYALWIILAGSAFTVVQRMVHVLRTRT